MTDFWLYRDDGAPLGCVIRLHEDGATCAYTTGVIGRLGSCHQRRGSSSIGRARGRHRRRRLVVKCAQRQLLGGLCFGDLFGRPRPHLPRRELLRGRALLHRGGGGRFAASRTLPAC